MMRQTLAPVPFDVLSGQQGSFRNPAGPRESFPDAKPAKWGLAQLAGSLVEISGTADSGVLSSALALVAEAQHHQLRQELHRHRPNPNSNPNWKPGPTPHPAPAPNPELIAWIATTRSLFFPPDAVESGIALDRLVLLRLETPVAQLRAATQVVHSGAFGLVVVDLADSLADSLPPESSGHPPVRQPVRKSAPTPGRLSGPGARGLMPRPGALPELPPLSRLAGLAHKYRTAVVLLTDKPPAAPSLDPRVGKRFDASRLENDIVITVLKDKRNGFSPSPGSAPLPGVPGGRDRFPSGVRFDPGARFQRKCREPAGMC